MKCTSIYPSPNSELNLKGILTIRKKGYLAGFSDHSKSFTASLCAVALGACVIEKHVKDDNDIKSLDINFSLPVVAKDFVKKFMKPGCLLVKTQLCSQKMKKNQEFLKDQFYVSKDIRK